MNELKVNVGILSTQKIHFKLNGYTWNGTDIIGEQAATFNNGKILWNGKSFNELEFLPKKEDSSFELSNVTIGINFHWERQETQTFQGALHIIIDKNLLTTINILPVENYLISVISSEMSATSSLELLKAHAIISRSWLISQIVKKNKLQKQSEKENSFIQTEDEYIRWYDREDHTLFDVCADDHCQRYQGITKASNPNVKSAVLATRGMILMNGEEICDARFYKCCGGITEEFQYAWENKTYPYLSAVYDSAKNCSLPDLTQEDEAEKWIRAIPDAFCNTQNKKILSQVLNNYDQETNDFYRWKVHYSQEEISSLIMEKSGIDFGKIIDLIPIERGKSGRLSKLKIVGTKKTLIIGKELEIRRTLSKTHLFSSAFVIDKEETEDGVPKGFLLTGAGWGHGVGLCQIGAAVMGEQGYSYDQILHHYYKNAEIKQLYQ